MDGHKDSEVDGLKRTLHGDNTTLHDPGVAAKSSPEFKAPSAPTGTVLYKKRKLIVCIDGTSNQFSDKNTNVVEMYHYIKKDESQLTYYNSGIGTFARPSWRSWSYCKQVLWNYVDLAIAWNLEKTIIGAYRWLSDTYKPGDQIFLFGFSRGAYQVRALAAMIKSVGLIYAGNQEQIPFAWDLYATYEPGDGRYQSRILSFRKTFSHDSVDLHFVGVWDTVSSIGIFRKNLLPLTDVCGHVTHFRHALALDECRVKFDAEYAQVSPWASLDQKKNTLKEVWFVGTHSDIGGGNQENLNLSNGAAPLRWMMEEAKSAGLILNPTHQHIHVNTRVTDIQITDSMQSWLFQLMEWIPAFTWYLHMPAENSRTRWFHMGRGRTVLPRQKLHWTVGMNREGESGRNSYRPKALLLGVDERSRLWPKVFKTFNVQSFGAIAAANNLRGFPEWERSDDLELTEIIRVMNQFNKHKEANKESYWLNRLFHSITKLNKADTIWVYGGPSLLQAIATTYGHKNIDSTRTVIRTVIGLSGDTSDNDVVHMNTFLRLNDLVSLCEHHEDCFNRLAMLLEWVPVIRAGKGYGIPNFVSSRVAKKDPLPYSSEFNSVVMEIVVELCRTKEHLDQMCSALDLSIVENLVASIPLLDILYENVMNYPMHRDLATQILEVLILIASNDRGRQKLLTAGITEKLSHLLNPVDNRIVYQTMRVFGALFGDAVFLGEAGNQYISSRAVRYIVKLTELFVKTDMEKKTIKEVLSILEQIVYFMQDTKTVGSDLKFKPHEVQYLIDLTAYHPEAINILGRLMLSRGLLNSDSTNLLTQWLTMNAIQKLLEKDEEATNEAVFRLISLIDDKHNGIKTNLVDCASLFRLSMKTSLSRESIRYLLSLVSTHLREGLSSGLLERIILEFHKIIRGKLARTTKPAEIGNVMQPAHAPRNPRVAELSEETNFVKEPESTEGYTATDQSIVSVLVQLFPHLTGGVVLQSLRAIVEFVRQDGTVTNTRDIVHLITFTLHQARRNENWDRGYELFGSSYDEIMSEVFDLVYYLSEDKPVGGKVALIQSEAYKPIFLLSQMPSHSMCKRVSKLVKDIREFVNDDEVNMELDKYSGYIHFCDATEGTPACTCDATAQYVVTELAGYTRSRVQNSHPHQVSRASCFNPTWCEIFSERLYFDLGSTPRS